MDEEGFQVVHTRKQKSVRTPVENFSHRTWREHRTKDTANGEEELVDITYVMDSIRRCREELKCSDLYKGVSTTLNHSLTRFHEENSSRETPVPLTTLICYGLGNFSSCVIARYQLALFLCLKEELNAEGSLFDPAFSTDEKTILTQLKLDVIPRNEEGKRPIDSPTLFYMPHCAKELYNNLLWANWSPSLSKLLILGNSFSHMMDSLPLRQFHQNWNYISKAVPLIEEYGVKNCFKFNDIFNDTAVHIFPKTKLMRLQDDFWLDHEEPIYHDDSFW